MRARFVFLGAESDVLERYGVPAFPTTFAIDKNGVVADVTVGSGSGLEALIETARAAAPRVAR